MQSLLTLRSLQRLGGISALVAAGTFAVGLATSATLLTDLASAATPAAAAAFIADNQLTVLLRTLATTIVFGVVLVPLVLAIADRLLRAHSPLARVATAFGLMWSGVAVCAGMITTAAYATVSALHGTDPEMAATVWSGLEAVITGLDGASRILGSVWMLGISIVALRERLFARWVNHLGVVLGVTGLVAVVPALQELGTAVELGSIVWFTAVGIDLTKADEPPAQYPAERSLGRLFETARAS